MPKYEVNTIHGWFPFAAHDMDEARRYARRVWGQGPRAVRASRPPRASMDEAQREARRPRGATCERCGLTYEIDDGAPRTNEPYTCDDCGGAVEPDGRGDEAADYGPGKVRQ
ncbi:MAG: hypothetical protein ABFD77_00045 [Thermotogota bacterium]